MKLDFDFFKIKHNNISPQTGRILISEPFLQDIYFSRSVVLLTEHNEQGTVGFILNKPTDIYINEVIKDFPEIECNVSLGGPVATNTMHYLHSLGDKIPDSVKILDDLYWGGDFSVVQQLIKVGILTANNIRFFIGYSGWSPNQLSFEIAQNSWLVSYISPSHIFQNLTIDFWKQSLNMLGSKYQYWSEFPQNPQMN